MRWDPLKRSNCMVASKIFFAHRRHRVHLSRSIWWDSGWDPVAPPGWMAPKVRWRLWAREAVSKMELRLLRFANNTKSQKKNLLKNGLRKLDNRELLFFLRWISGAFWQDNKARAQRLWPSSIILFFVCRGSAFDFQWLNLVILQVSILTRKEKKDKVTV